MKKLLFALILSISFSATAKEIVVSAFGEGEDYDWAVLNAVENAVRQTSAISVSRNGLHKIDASAYVAREKNNSANAFVQGSSFADVSVNDDGVKRNGNIQGDIFIQAEGNASETEKITTGVQDNSKYIPAQYQGVVSSYEVVEHTQLNGKHQVKINALIIKEDVYDSHDYKSKRLKKKADYSLAVLPFKTTKKFTCLGQALNLNEINTLISNAFIEHLTPSHKFNMVDRNNFDNYADEIALITDNMTLAENKTSLRNIVPADYILVGNIDHFSASQTRDYIALTGETNYSASAKVKISYRLLETATMEIISAGSVEKTFRKESAFSSCSAVEELLFSQAIKEASEKLLTDIFPDYTPAPKAIPSAPQRKRTQPIQSVNYALPLN